MAGGDSLEAPRRVVAEPGEAVVVGDGPWLTGGMSVGEEGVGPDGGSAGLWWPDEAAGARGG